MNLQKITRSMNLQKITRSMNLQKITRSMNLHFSTRPFRPGFLFAKIYAFDQIQAHFATRFVQLSNPPKGGGIAKLQPTACDTATGCN
jgi:hypothetical protein